MLHKEHRTTSIFWFQWRCLICSSYCVILFSLSSAFGSMPCLAQTCPCNVKSTSCIDLSMSDPGPRPTSRPRVLLKAPTLAEMEEMNISEVGSEILKGKAGKKKNSSLGITVVSSVKWLVFLLPSRLHFLCAFRRVNSNREELLFCFAWRLRN